MLEMWMKLKVDGEEDEEAWTVGWKRFFLKFV